MGTRGREGVGVVVGGVATVASVAAVAAVAVDGGGVATVVVGIVAAPAPAPAPAVSPAVAMVLTLRIPRKKRAARNITALNRGSFYQFKALLAAEAL